MPPSCGISTAPLFKFQPRRESVDWRRINTVDIDKVISQVDVGVLQEYTNAVTFCSLDDERCPWCQNPVDPVLIKLFRLAQLTVEYLDHCQELLTVEMQALEEKLEAADEVHVQLLTQQKRKEELIKKQKDELKQRKKAICMQQRLLAQSNTDSYECRHCEKSYLNALFLQNHMERRHPKVYLASLSLSDGERKSEIDSLKAEITALKEQLVQQQQTIQTKIAQEREQESMHIDLSKEMARMDRRMEENTDGIRRELELLCSQNIRMLNDANQQQSKIPSPVPIKPENDLDNYKEIQQQAIHTLEETLKKQDERWETRLQDIKEQHETEKNQLLNELNRMHNIVSEQLAQTQKLGQELDQKLQEQEQTIKSQEEQIKKMSSSPQAKIVEMQVFLDPKQKKPRTSTVHKEKPSSAPMLDTIQELPEEDRVTRSVSETNPVKRKLEPALQTKECTDMSAQRIDSLRTKMRQEIEKSLMRELKSHGFMHNCSEITTKKLESKLVRVNVKRQRISQMVPEYWSYRQKLDDDLEDKLKELKKRRDQTRSNRNKQPMQELQVASCSYGLPRRPSTLMSVSLERLIKTPQPSPSTKLMPQLKKFTPKNRTRRPPPQTTESEEEEELDQRNKYRRVQNRTRSVRTKPQSRRLFEVTKTKVTQTDRESGDSWLSLPLESSDYSIGHSAGSRHWPRWFGGRTHRR